jgi:antitoxin YefM
MYNLIIMKIASTSNFRKNIKRFVDEIDQDQEPLVITRSDNVSVVVLPLSTYNSYAETDYLLRSPANAKRLRRSLKQARLGKVEEHQLIEP